MLIARYSIVTIAFVVIAACGVGDDGKPNGDPDQTPAVSKTDKGSRDLNPGTVEKRLAQKFAESNSLGDSFTSVTCPDRISSRLGDETTCDVEFAAGGFGNATIKITDDKGDFDIIGISASVAD